MTFFFVPFICFTRGAKGFCTTLGDMGHRFYVRRISVFLVGPGGGGGGWVRVIIALGDAGKRPRLFFNCCVFVAVRSKV